MLYSGLLGRRHVRLHPFYEEELMTLYSCRYLAARSVPTDFNSLRASLEQERVQAKMACIYVSR